MSDRDARRLFGGPQDGARVKPVGGRMPPRIYVGPKWLGDGYAAWSDEACERFPAEYADGGNGRMVFEGYKAALP